MSYFLPWHFTKKGCIMVASTYHLTTNWLTLPNSIAAVSFDQARRKITTKK